MQILVTFFLAYVVKKQYFCSGYSAKMAEMTGLAQELTPSKCKILDYE